MLITSSNILLSSSRAYASSHQVEERLRVWEGDQRPDFEAIENRDVKAALRALPHDAIEFSEGALNAANEATQAASETAPAREPDALTPEDEAKIIMLEKLLEQVTGKKIKLKVMRVEQADDKHAQAAAAQLQRSANEERNGNSRVGWGVEYDRVEHHSETERTAFTSSGVVRTADGKEIAISVELTMSREFVTHNEEHLRLGDAVRKDPLVINFSGNAAQLTTDKFSFDIDTDGTADQISFVTAGSGFLAIDKNGDGTINNGSELFGPATGDGFAELVAYDADGNHWIDEGDAVFNRLRIWTKDAAGGDQLSALGQVGVGAIYLGNVATQFSINDAANQQLGQVQSTGLWLGEKGGAGTVQHIDLVV